MPTIDHAIVVELAVSYLLHSTVLLLLTWMLSAGMPGNPVFRAGLWRAVLVLPLLTCLVSRAIDMNEWSWTPPPLAAAPTTTAEVDPAVEITPHAEPLQQAVAPDVIADVRPDAGDADEEWHVAIQPAIVPPDDESPAETAFVLPPPTMITSADLPRALSYSEVPPAEVPVNRGISWMPLAAWVLLASTVVGVCLFGLRAFRDVLRLGRVVDVSDATVLRRFERLLLRSGLRRVRLVVSPHIREPGACGIFRPTIVIPDGLCDSLAPGEWDAVLAHELAHLVRRDPFWLLCARFVSALTAWQPLNRFAVQQWRRAAEQACDEWAIERGVPPMALARSLTEVAEWRLNGGHAVGLTATGDASELARRITRLADPPPKSRRTILRAVMLGGLAIMLALSAPRLSLTGESSLPSERVHDDIVQSVSPDVALRATEPLIAADATAVEFHDAAGLAELIEDLRRLDELLAAGPSDPQIAEIRARISKRLEDIQQQLAHLNEN